MPSGRDWRPTASLDNLRTRARLLAQARAFFDARGVLEVETPLLSRTVATDPYLESASIRHPTAGELYLQTSPEHAMKRLLAAGTGAIYQISKAFRAGERSPRHNPEFTILEWYRPGFDHHALMDEVDALLTELLRTEPAERATYEELFRRHVGLDPHSASSAALRVAAREHDLPEAVGFGETREDWLNLLMAQLVEPTLGESRPFFVFDFPRELAALARLDTRPGRDITMAERFEVFFKGMELANGYHELTDASLQRERFRRELERRKVLGRHPVPLDERLLEAMRAGLPASAGVALGFDRLVMIAVGADSIDDVLSFPLERA